MQSGLLDYLICPKTRERLQLQSPTYDGDEIVSGQLASSVAVYPIHNGLPRFVTDHYATAFGLQWNKHARTSSRWISPRL